MWDDRPKRSHYSARVGLVWEQGVGQSRETMNRRLCEWENHERGKHWVQNTKNFGNSKCRGVSGHRRAKAPHRNNVKPPRTKGTTYATHWSAAKMRLRAIAPAERSPRQTVATSRVIAPRNRQNQLPGANHTSSMALAAWHCFS